MNTLLQEIHKDMKVFDRDQTEIGTVERVQFGDEDPLQPGAETATVNPVQRDTHDTLVESILDVFGPDDIPKVLHDRLIRQGFVRVDAPGLFNADRYILPDQIQSVSGNKVNLKVTKQELIKRP